MLAIIGGSGFEKFEGVEEIATVALDSPFGLASTGLRRIRLFGKECFFLPRHGRHHELLPSEVNYKANIYVLKKLGTDRILAFSAVGSLQKELAPGDLVIPSQYIDRTKGVRKSTFCGEGIVAHVTLADPIWMKGMEWLQSQASAFDFKIHWDKTYVCIEGPHFSTRAESQSYRMMGGDIIGMTHFPEYALAREAALSYLPCCFVTDYDSWDKSVEPVKIQMVLAIMKESNRKAYALLKEFLAQAVMPDENIQSLGLASSLLSLPELSVHQQELLATLSAKGT